MKDGRNMRSVWSVNTKPYAEAHFATYPEKLIEPMIKAGCPVDGIVLDTFNGAGTTGVVAKKQQKNYIGIELNQEYIDLSVKRINEIVVQNKLAL
jgi:site-specific DNA-methyltransferase (adenine-specific)